MIKVACLCSVLVIRSVDVLNILLNRKYHFAYFKNFLGREGGFILLNYWECRFSTP
ncbi:hypothetical protein [Aliikangiella sp. IMCC44359]|uniref:hypothetical protein n=1 Tax=Aliikangiella sp. IMCC44359 TaxID=3459125 RepID=UPI00403AAE80